MKKKYVWQFGEPPPLNVMYFLNDPLYNYPNGISSQVKKKIVKKKIPLFFALTIKIVCWKTILPRIQSLATSR